MQNDGENEGGHAGKLVPPLSEDVVETVAKQTDTPPTKVRTVVRTYEEQIIRSGPFPPPETIADYEQILPGASKIIFDMVVSAQRHAQDMDRLTVKSEIDYRNLGIYAAAAILIAMVLGAVICAMVGNNAGAITLGSAAGLASVAGVFVRGRNLFGSAENKSGATPSLPRTTDRSARSDSEEEIGEDRGSSGPSGSERSA